MSNAKLDAALDYLNRGWKPIRVNGKVPCGSEWQKQEPNESDIKLWFGRPTKTNIGVLNGMPSGGLVDVDLDHRLAVELADQFLPETGAVFGRPGKPRSHRLFHSPDTETHQREVAQEIGGTLVELRSTGSQTVMPPSTHSVSGELISWDIQCEPAKVDDKFLKACVDALADEVERRLGIEPRKFAKDAMPSTASGTEDDIERATEALTAIPASYADCYSSWLKIGMSLRSISDSLFTAWDNWSRTSQKYRESETVKKWESFSGDGGIGPGTLFHLAKANGWKPKPRRCSQTAYKPPGLPYVCLPDGITRISDTAAEFGEHLAATKKFYVRSGVPLRAIVDDRGELHLEPMRPASAASDFESVARIVRTKMVAGEPTEVATICSEAVARMIIAASAFTEKLPPIRVMSRCPVLIERGGSLEIISSYDRDSGIWAMGSPPPAMSIDDARKLLESLVGDTHFATPGDKSRAVAALITPALVFGGLLGGRSPIDVGEADESQSGKGYRNKITTGIYRYNARTITQRERGVGSLQEGFDACLVAGAPFVAFDNIRGNLNAPWFESFMTEPSYSARVPYSSAIEMDATRTVILLTTNRAELTRDLANRSSVVRIRKHGDDYCYRQFPEGDLLAHVEANQPKYLGAVFSIIREWNRQGKPTITNVAHDFRRWAQVLGWMVEKLLGYAPLTEGHRELQARMTTPALTWLRDVALAVKDSGNAGEWLRSNKLLGVVLARSIDTLGISADCDTDEGPEFGKAVRALGRQLAKAVTKDEIKVDDVIVRRRSVTDTDSRERKEYAFFLGTPNAPEWSPESKPLNPESPESLGTLCKASDVSMYIDNKSSASMRGIGGTTVSFGGIAGDSSVVCEDAQHGDAWEFGS